MGAENRGSVFCRGAEADPSVVFYGPGNRRTGAQRSLRSRFPVASLLRPGEFGDDIRKPRGLSAAVLESTLVSFCMRGDLFWTALRPGGPRVLAPSSWLCQPYRVSIPVLWRGIRKPCGLSAAVLKSTLVSFCVSGRSVFGLPSGRAGRACSRRAVGCVSLIVCRFLLCGVAYTNLMVCRLPCWNRLWFRSVCGAIRFRTALRPGGPRVLAPSSWLCRPYRVSIPVLWCGIRNPYGLSAAVLESTLVSFCVSGRSVLDCPRAGRAARARAERLAVSALCRSVLHPFRCMSLIRGCRTDA